MRVEIGYHGLGKVGIGGQWLVMVGVVGHFGAVAVTTTIFNHFYVFFFS